MYTKQELDVTFKLKNSIIRGKNLMSACPFAEENHDNGEDLHPSFGINLENGKWNCYSCRERGTSLRTLARKKGILLPDDLMMKSLSLAPKMEDTKNAIPNYDFSVINKNNKEELYKEMLPRGITKDALIKHQVGYNEGSIQFPCVLPNGNLVGIIERNKIWDGRYGFTPQGVKREFLLFGLIEEVEEVWLTESMTDMLKLSSFGVTAVSTCGNMIFKKQAEIISSHTKRLILVPQRDEGAKKWLADARRLFKGKLPVWGYSIPSNLKDIGEADFTEEIFNSTRSSIISVY